MCILNTDVLITFVLHCTYKKFSVSYFQSNLNFNEISESWNVMPSVLLLIIDDLMDGASYWILIIKLNK